MNDTHQHTLASNLSLSIVPLTINQEAKRRAVNDAYLADLVSDVLLARHLDPKNIIKHIKAAEAKCLRKKDRLTFVRIRKSPDPLVMLDNAAKQFGVVIEEVSNRYVAQDDIKQAVQERKLKQRKRLV